MIRTSGDLCYDLFAVITAEQRERLRQQRETYREQRAKHSEQLLRLKEEREDMKEKGYKHEDDLMKENAKLQVHSWNFVTCMIKRHPGYSDTTGLSQQEVLTDQMGHPMVLNEIDGYFFH